MPGPKFSLIIPAYNEESYLPRLLASVRRAANVYGAQEVEVIVADNLSTDLTAEVAQRFGARVVRVEKRCIASARNGGALAAAGEILCFIDADSAVHENTFLKIEEAMDRARHIGGATGVRLERLSIGLVAVCCFMYPLLWITRFDTGVVFCRRADFEALGGYDEELLLGEDVRFLWALTRRGFSTGRRLTRLKGVPALGCIRKFDEHGQWHYFSLLGRVILSLLRTGLRSPTSIQNDPNIAGYWYDPGR